MSYHYRSNRPFGLRQFLISLVFYNKVLLIIRSITIYAYTPCLPGQTSNALPRHLIHRQSCMSSRQFQSHSVKSLTTTESRHRPNNRWNQIYFNANPSNEITNVTKDEQSSNSKTNDVLFSYYRQLFFMCRPINFPIVTLFHVLGVHLALKQWKSVTGISSIAQPLLLPLLKYSPMMMVLLSLLLVTSTSMITNDYYDARNGVDAYDSFVSLENAPAQHHPLARGLLPFSITKTFDSYLYAILLLSSAFVPGVCSRLMVISGAIITYLYTENLKPITLIKNLSCAALISMSPVTSGLAALHVLCQRSFLERVGAGGIDISLIPSFFILKSSLTQLVLALFAGIMSREILMDITDYESDSRAKIMTIPVRYSKRVASYVALGWSLVAALAACGSHVILGISSWSSHILALPIKFTLITNCSFSSISAFLSSMKKLHFSFGTVVHANANMRKIFLSILGSGMLLQRAYAVATATDNEVALADQAVRDSLFSVLLVLASFV